MARKLLLLLFGALASCSRGAQADLPSIGEARSLAAEWALINEQSAEGHLTGVYARTMRQAIRDQLQTTSRSLAQPRSPYGTEIESLLREADDAPPAELRVHAGKLKQIEDKLESA